MTVGACGANLKINSTRRQKALGIPGMETRTIIETQGSGAGRATLPR
jgi:hypothetical protein